MDNQERAAIAGQVLNLYGELKAGDEETNPQDLISDILHYAQQQGMDTDQILQSAQMNFEAERDEETEETNAPS